MCSDTAIRSNSKQRHGIPAIDTRISHHGKMMRPGLYAIGTISSLQNDENGNSTWVVSGLWEGSLSMDNKAQGGRRQSN